MRMDSVRRFYAHRIFELQVRKAKGYAYQDLFNEIMSRTHKDFVPIRPYGNQGDRKNDGYIPATGTFYQVYAPNNPDEKLAEAAKKAADDFAGLKAFWDQTHPIRAYRFVFNDEYGGFRGSIVPLEKSLAKIASENKIDAAAFLAKHLEDEAFSLDLEGLQLVLGTIIPEPGLLEDADYSAVRDVVEYVLNMARPAVDPPRLVAPTFDRKLEFNGLSRNVAALLTPAAFQIEVVDDYFSSRSGAYRQVLRDHLAAIYVKERDSYTDGAVPGDRVFFAVLHAITPPSERMRKSVQDAALVVMAYYFEACDIFEDPNAAT
jgi:hypothetical protein